MSSMAFMERLLDGVEVEWKFLGDVAEIKRGTSITKSDVTDGDVPVIAGGRSPAYFHNISNRNGQTIVIAGSGAYAGYVSWWDQPIFVSDAFTVKPSETLLVRYCYHFLMNKQQQLHELKSGGGVPHVYPRDVAPIQIPIPCPENPKKSLEIQAEIVRILDAFTAHTAELTAELTARKQQYNYYRDQLLTFKEGEVEWTSLENVCQFKNGFAFKSSLFRDSGSSIVRITNINGSTVDLVDVKFFNPSDYKENTQSYAIKKGDILIAMSGATTGKIGYFDLNETAYLNQRVGKFVPKVDLLSNRYLYHFLLSKTEQIYVLAGGGAQPNLSSNILMEKLMVPIPYSDDPIKSIKEQQRIVSILDKLDTLINSISEGLPREIALRQQQYEYYRDQLLSFPKPEVA